MWPVLTRYFGPCPRANDSAHGNMIDKLVGSLDDRSEETSTSETTS